MNWPRTLLEWAVEWIVAQTSGLCSFIHGSEIRVTIFRLGDPCHDIHGSEIRVTIDQNQDRDLAGHGMFLPPRHRIFGFAVHFRAKLQLDDAVDQSPVVLL